MRKPDPDVIDPGVIVAGIVVLASLASICAVAFALALELRGAL